MKLILLGPPGSGKGTQGQMICDAYSMVHISTGDILRQAVKDETGLGLEVKTFMEQGQLVSDELINQMMAERLTRDDCKNSFMLDGFPRTMEQAEFLMSQNIEVDRVILIDVPDQALVRRIVGRRVHPASGRIYHIEFSPPKIKDKDDITGEDLVHRSDDYEQTVLSRLQSYHKQTSPLIDFYKNQNKLIAVDGDKEPKIVFADLKKNMGLN